MGGTDLTEDEVLGLRSEQMAASMAGLSWQERGPRAAAGEDQQPTWRGQRWRKGVCGGKVRYAKRGGQWQQYYKGLNKAGLLKPGKDGATVVMAPWWEEQEKKMK